MCLFSTIVPLCDSKARLNVVLHKTHKQIKIDSRLLFEVKVGEL